MAGVPNLQNDTPQYLGVGRMVRIGVAVLVVGFFALLSSELRDRFGDTVDDWLQGAVLVPPIVVYCVVLFAALLLPISPSLPILSAGIVAFGPFKVFVVSYAVGIIAASVTYWVGRTAGAKLVSRKWHLVQVIQEKLKNRRSFWVVFGLKVVPHPLYDAVGYAAGASRTSFRDYILASMCGGAILLGLFCGFAAT